MGRTKVVKDGKGNELLFGDFINAGQVVGRIASFGEDDVRVVWPQIPGGVCQAATFKPAECELVLTADGKAPGEMESSATAGTGEGVQVDGQGLAPAMTKPKK